MGKVVSKLQQKLALQHSQSDKFPFGELPDVCKIHIFSFLNVDERTSAARVCTEWRHLLSSPALWTDVDVPASVRAVMSLQHAGQDNEAMYHTRVKKFFDFIGKVDPCIRRFVFVGDIADTVYHDSLRSFIMHARLTELQCVNINWSKMTVHDTAESNWQHGETSASLCKVDENRRRRQRYFVHIFEQLCCAAPNITSLSLPFDWSPKSVEAIVRLRGIEELCLSRYSELQPLDCVTLERVVSGLPRLRRLELEVWTPCASGGLSFYSLRSKSLEVVDLSRCRGFTLGSADLPRVRVLKMSRCPWSGPLLVQNPADVYTMPCLHRVLSDGVPNLVKLNDSKLRDDWHKNADNMESLLNSLCPCGLHYGWDTIVEDCF